MTRGKPLACLAAWLLFGLAPALRGQENPEEVEGAAQSQASEEDLLQAMREKLKSDPGVGDSLAERINRSSLAGKISSASNEAVRLREIREWIEGDPDSAAGLALGLAKDDAEGSRRFENLLNRDVRTHLVPNPEAVKNLFGRLKKASADSKLMKQDEEMMDEEQREILKTLFEGKGSQSNRIITQEERAGPGRETPGGPAGATLSSGYYDRLSQANLGGYSPQLQAFQSALNALRVPGAPKLIETGKLDYETLGYPAHAMRYDIGNLERRLRLERNFALARLLGREREFSPEQLLDPEVEARLKVQAAGKGNLSPPFERRQAALEKAAAAVREFDRTAVVSKDPAQITRALLMSLGSKQKEAARWITVAALQEELERLESEEKFLSPELLALIARVPVEEGSRLAYRRRGAEFQKSLARIKANDEAAIQRLESDQWLKQIDAVQKMLAENASLRKDLSRNIGDFVRTPYALNALAARKPRWRELLDSLVKRFLPSSSYARSLKRADAQGELLKDVFLKIATGNLDAAHAILSQYEPSGGPPSKR